MTNSSDEETDSRTALVGASWRLSLQAHIATTSLANLLVQQGEKESETSNFVMEHHRTLLPANPRGERVMRVDPPETVELAAKLWMPPLKLHVPSKWRVGVTQIPRIDPGSSRRHVWI
ncbi:unnamed protein product [Penicillium bialowiezense]